MLQDGVLKRLWDKCECGHDESQHPHEGSAWRPCRWCTDDGALGTTSCAHFTPSYDIRLLITEIRAARALAGQG